MKLRSFTLGSLILCLDLFSKYYVYLHLPFKWGRYPYGGIGVFKNLGGIELSIVHVTNTGAAWGMFAHMQLPLVILRITAICLLLYCICKKKLCTSEHIALTSILAGALGNVADYFLYGHVIDMFYFRLGNLSCPVFNIADTAIFCGVAWLILSRFYKRLICA